MGTRTGGQEATLVFMYRPWVCTYHALRTLNWIGASKRAEMCQTGRVPHGTLDVNSRSEPICDENMLVIPYLSLTLVTETQ